MLKRLAWFPLAFAGALLLGPVVGLVFNDLPSTAGLGVFVGVALGWWLAKRYVN